MADESGKPKKSGSPYIPIAAALFIGIVIGGALFSSRGLEREVERDLAAAQSAMTEQLSAARSEIDQQITALGERADAAGEQIARLDPVEEGVAALRSAGEEIASRLDALTGRVDESMSSQTEAGERVEFLENRVQTMAGQMAQMSPACRRWKAARPPRRPRRLPVQETPPRRRTPSRSPLRRPRSASVRWVRSAARRSSCRVSTRPPARWA